MLPCSALRLSFFGDSGTQERIVTIRRDSNSASVKLEGILEDKSRRSFIIKLPNGRHIFFWQSEKSKTYGDELLSKMRELLARRPTLVHLTGISPSRIQTFSDYLRAFLVSLSSSNAGDNSPSCTPPVVTRPSQSAVVQLTPSLTPILNALLSNHSFLGASSLQTKATPTDACPRAKVEKRSNAPVRSNPTFKASGCKDSFLRVASTARPFSGSKDKHRRHRKGSSVHSSSAASLVSPPSTPVADSSGKLNHKLAIGSLNASKTTQAFSQSSSQDGAKSSLPSERMHTLHSKLSQDEINHVNLPAVNLQRSVLSYGQRIPNVWNPPLSSNIRIAIFKPCSDGQNESPKSTSTLLSKSLKKPAGSNPLGHVIEADSYMLFAVNNGQPLSGSGARLTMITPSTEDKDEFSALPNVKILQVGLCRSCKANCGNFEVIVKAILGQCLDLNIKAKSSKPMQKIPVILLCNRLASGRISDLYHFLMQKLKRKER
ncbi:hypothetical protein O6H91_Y230500 [Diphasiastrum complanatum]|nr:hypothetical protein O6H91_Y230500 [Diphasiastrum complanatum]